MSELRLVVGEMTDKQTRSDVIKVVHGETSHLVTLLYHAYRKKNPGPVLFEKPTKSEAVIKVQF